MTPAPSPRDLDALAPLVDSAYSEMCGVPESAFITHTTIGELWVVPLSDYQAMQASARAGQTWRKRALAAEKAAAFFGFIVALITAAQILRWWAK